MVKFHTGSIVCEGIFPLTECDSPTDGKVRMGEEDRLFSRNIPILSVLRDFFLCFLLFYTLINYKRGMIMMSRKYQQITKNLVAIALFSALAYGVTFVFRIPVTFLTFDAKDAVIAVASFIYGPIAAVAMSLITAFLELITVSGTGFYGFIMNFVSSAVFSGVAALIYRYRRTMNGVFIALGSAIVSMTAVMLLMNCWITPFYMGVDREVVIGMLASLLLPFNLAKALLNAAAALLLYKPISLALHRAHILPARASVWTEGEKTTGAQAQSEYRLDRKTVTVVVVAVLMAVAAIIIFVTLNR